MGFTLKNIISSFVMPLPLAFTIGIIGLFLLFFKKEKQASIFLLVSFTLIFLFSYNPISNKLIHSLEVEYPAVKKVDKSVKYALLLGGDFQDRGYAILEIYNQNKNITIITSGYAGKNPISEAMKNKKRLIKLGVPESSIIALESARDTIEEAEVIKNRLHEKPFYLVTSAYHMPRAYAIFQSFQLHPIAYPTGKLAKEVSISSFISAGSAYQSQIAMHEYISLLWLKVKKLFY